MTDDFTPFEPSPRAIYQRLLSSYELGTSESPVSLDLEDLPADRVLSPGYYRFTYYLDPSVDEERTPFGQWVPVEGGENYVFYRLVSSDRNSDQVYVDLQIRPYTQTQSFKIENGLIGTKQIAEGLLIDELLILGGLSAGTVAAAIIFGVLLYEGLITKDAVQEDVEEERERLCPTTRPSSLALYLIPSTIGLCWGRGRATPKNEYVSWYQYENYVRNRIRSLTTGSQELDNVWIVTPTATRTGAIGVEVDGFTLGFGKHVPRAVIDAKCWKQGGFFDYLRIQGLPDMSVDDALQEEKLFEEDPSEHFDYESNFFELSQQGDGTSPYQELREALLQAPNLIMGLTSGIPQSRIRTQLDRQVSALSTEGTTSHIIWVVPSTYMKASVDNVTNSQMQRLRDSFGFSNITFEVVVIPFSRCK